MSFIGFILQAVQEGAVAATEATSSSGATGRSISTIVMLVGMFVVFYFFIIRPNSKRDKKQKQLMAELKEGDMIVTIGGAHGKIKHVKEKTVIVKIDDNASMEFEKSAIARVVVQTA